MAYGINDAGEIYTIDTVTGQKTFVASANFSAYGLAMHPLTGALYYTESTSSNARLGSYDPSFGTNQNVMCYLDDIYVYLKARGMEDVPRGRPAKKEAKSDMIREQEDACMG